MKISILNLQKNKRIKKIALRKIIEEICRFIDIERGQISFVLTDNKKIQALNKEYFGKDRPTDVICFCLTDVVDPLNMLGEIIISVEMAVENAAIFSTDTKKELILIS